MQSWYFIQLLTRRMNMTMFVLALVIGLVLTGDTYIAPMLLITFCAYHLISE